MKQKRRVFPVIVAALLSLTSVVASAQNEFYLGTWTFNAPMLPAGFNSGLIRFNQEADSLSGVFIVGGKNLKAKKVTIDGEKAAMEFEVSGTPLIFAFEKSEEGVKGSTSFQNTPVEIFCKRFNLGDAIAGSWNIQVYDAPAGYEKGTLTFDKTAGGEVTTLLKFGDSSTTGAGFKSEMTRFSFTIDVQGNNIPVQMEWKDSFMTGEANADGQTYKFAAYRALD